MGACTCKVKVVSSLKDPGSPVRIILKRKQIITKCKGYIVTKDELIVLRELFQDLTQKNSIDETIDKVTFLRFFELPVIFDIGLARRTIVSEIRHY